MTVFFGGQAPVAASTWQSKAFGVPLIVDAAWAAYFGFHPDLPPHALAAGADALVTSAFRAARNLEAKGRATDMQEVRIADDLPPVVKTRIEDAAAMAKEAINRAFETPLSEGMSVERNLFHSTFALEDRAEGMAAYAHGSRGSDANGRQFGAGPPVPYTDRSRQGAAELPSSAISGHAVSPSSFLVSGH